jgi:GTP-binding protein
MTPTLVIVGRPNVGKSTLFNRLTRSRDALVADMPGLTRDRHYGHGRVGLRPYLVVDTGGFEPNAKEGILAEMAQQAEAAIAEADMLLFVVDGRAGLTAQDKDHRRATAPHRSAPAAGGEQGRGHGARHCGAEFHELACGEPLVISAAHGDGVRELVDEALAPFPEAERRRRKVSRRASPWWAGPTSASRRSSMRCWARSASSPSTSPAPRAMPSPCPFQRKGKDYTLIDTAGLRRKGKVFEAVEKFSVIKTLQSIEEANVVVLVLDASQDISDQDAHIAGFCVEAGRAMVVAVNKWDSADDYRRERIKMDMTRKLNFLGFAKSHFICALKGEGINPLMASVDAAYAASMVKMPTPKLTRLLQAAVEKQAPPRHGIFRPKLRYAHQGGNNPPIIVIHGNALDHVPDAYRRYLERTFIEAFKLKGTPLRVEFRTTRNPLCG